MWPERGRGNGLKWKHTLVKPGFPYDLRFGSVVENACSWAHLETATSIIAFDASLVFFLYLFLFFFFFINFYREGWSYGYRSRGLDVSGTPSFHVQGHAREFSVSFLVSQTLDSDLVFVLFSIAF